MLDYLEILHTPSITEPDEQEILENEDALFTTVVTGKPEPTVEWFHGFTKLRPSDTVIIDNVGDRYSLQLRNCQLEDTGSITVAAFNKAGSNSADTALIVKGKTT